VGLHQQIGLTLQIVSVEASENHPSQTLGFCASSPCPVPLLVEAQSAGTPSAIDSRRPAFVYGAADKLCGVLPNPGWHRTTSSWP
jgi:hypothetical protein